MFNKDYVRLKTMMLRDDSAFEEIVVTLSAPTFSTTIIFNPLILNVYAYAVIGVDLSDTNPLSLADPQAVWMLRCQEIGNSSKHFYRINGSPISNVIKFFSRAALSQANPFMVDYYTEITPMNLSNMTLTLTSAGGSLPDVNGTTNSINVTIRLLRSNKSI